MTSDGSTSGVADMEPDELLQPGAARSPSSGPPPATSTDSPDGVSALAVAPTAAEVILQLIPGALRESALALGAPRWRVIFSIVLPTALPGIVTGVLLAIARAAGETAPLLFTAGATLKANLNLGQFMNSLPVQIYSDVTSPTTAVVNRAWGAALTLVVMILLLNLIARLVSRRSRLA